MVFTKTARAELLGNDENWLRQLLLRLALSICSIVAIVCYGWSVVSDHLYDDYGGLLVLIGLTPAAIAIIYTTVNTLYISIRHRPYHPAVNVAFDLINTSFFTIAAVNVSASAIWVYLDVGFNTYVALHPPSRPHDTIAQNGSIIHVPSPYGRQTPLPPCPGWDSCAVLRASYDRQQTLANLGVAGSAFFNVAVILQFTLFVLACLETHRRNTDGYIQLKATTLAELRIEAMRREGRLPGREEEDEAVGDEFEPGQGRVRLPADPRAARRLSCMSR